MLCYVVLCVFLCDGQKREGKLFSDREFGFELKSRIHIGYFGIRNQNILACSLPAQRGKAIFLPYPLLPRDQSVHFS